MLLVLIVVLGSFPCRQGSTSLAYKGKVPLECLFLKRSFCTVGSKEIEKINLEHVVPLQTHRDLVAAVANVCVSTAMPLEMSLGTIVFP